MSRRHGTIARALKIGGLVGPLLAGGTAWAQAGIPGAGTGTTGPTGQQSGGLGGGAGVPGSEYPMGTGGLQQPGLGGTQPGLPGSQQPGLGTTPPPGLGPPGSVPLQTVPDAGVRAAPSLRADGGFR